MNGRKTLRGGSERASEESRRWPPWTDGRETGQMSRSLSSRCPSKDHPSCFCLYTSPFTHAKKARNGFKRLRAVIPRQTRTARNAPTATRTKRSIAVAAVSEDGRRHVVKREIRKSYKTASMTARGVYVQLSKQRGSKQAGRQAESPNSDHHLSPTFILTPLWFIEGESLTESASASFFFWLMVRLNSACLAKRLTHKQMSSVHDAFFVTQFEQT